MQGFGGTAAICRQTHMLLNTLISKQLENSSMRLLYMTAGICSHSHTRASVRSGTDVGWWWFWLAVWVLIYPKDVQLGLQVWALWRQVEFFNTRLSKSFLYGPRFVLGALCTGSENEVFQKIKNRMSLFTVVLLPKVMHTFDKAVINDFNNARFCIKGEVRLKL